MLESFDRKISATYTSLRLIRTITFNTLMLTWKKEYNLHLLAAIVLYMTVLIYQGYQYGQSDQTQILPAIYAEEHPEYYVNDHYVQTYQDSRINERSIFHFLFKHTGYDHPWLVFLWHAIAGILLILAWILIASIFIKNQLLQWLSIGMILVIGYHTSVGSNEIYYNQFVPSLPAKALASWALYCWLTNRFQWWVLLLIIATYLQPLVGLQLFLVTSIALLFDHYRKNLLPAFPWKYVVVYLITVIPWIILLAINNGGHQDPDSFMEIIKFRLSHHFFASSFGFAHLFLWIILAIVALVYYKDRMRWSMIIILIGCVVYVIGVEVLDSPVILYTQWWKTTIWLEAFAFIAAMAWVEKKFDKPALFNNYKWHLVFAFFALIALYRLTGVIGNKPLYMHPLSNSVSPEVDISLRAGAVTPLDAVFIVPPELSAFRWYSKRSLYVDYKAMIHNENFLNEWYKRLGKIYYINPKSNRYTFIRDANNILKNPTQEKMESWEKAGITHFISTSPDIGFLKPVTGNEFYFIYQLP